MSTKTKATTIDVSVKDRWRVQGIKDDDGGGSGLTMGLVDWQQQRSVDFPCFRVANSNTVSSLSSRCLVLVFFHQIPFFRSLHEILSVLQSCGKCFCTKCTLTLRMHPLCRGEFKKRVLMINKDIRKSLAHKNGNNNPIWRWKNSYKMHQKILHEQIM